MKIYRFLTGCLISALIITAAWWLPRTGAAATVYKIWFPDTLTGGTSTSLDGINSGTSGLVNNAFAIVCESSTSKVYVFKYDSSATGTENTSTYPYTVIPDNMPSTGLWTQQKVGNLDLDGHDTGTSVYFLNQIARPDGTGTSGYVLTMNSAGSPFWTNVVAGSGGSGGTTGVSIFAQDDDAGSFTGQENIYISGESGMQVEVHGTAGVSLFSAQDLQTTAEVEFAGVTPTNLFPGAIYDENDLSGTSDQILKRTGTGITWTNDESGSGNGGGTTGVSVFAQDDDAGSFTGQENIYISGESGMQVEAQGTAGVSIFPIKGTSDSGASLMVTGVGNTSSTTPFAVEDSTGVVDFSVSGDGITRARESRFSDVVKLSRTIFPPTLEWRSTDLITRYGYMEGSTSAINLNMEGTGNAFQINVGTEHSGYEFVVNASGVSAEGFISGTTGLTVHDTNGGATIFLAGDAGVFLDAATGEVWVVDTGGQNTQLSAHDVERRFVDFSFNRYTGDVYLFEKEKWVRSGGKTADIPGYTHTTWAEVTPIMGKANPGRKNPEQFRREAWIRSYMKHGSIEVPEAQAFETVDDVQIVRKVQIQPGKFRIKNGKVEKYERKITVPTKIKLGTKTVLKTGHRLDEDTGKIYRRPTRNEAELAAVTDFHFDWASVPARIRAAWGH